MSFPEAIRLVRGSDGVGHLAGCPFLALASEGPPEWRGAEARARDIARSALLRWFGEAIADKHCAEFAQDCVLTLPWEGGSIRFEDAEDWLILRRDAEPAGAAGTGLEVLLALVWTPSAVLLVAARPLFWPLAIPGVLALPAAVAWRFAQVGALRRELRAKGYPAVGFGEAAELMARARSLAGDRPENMGAARRLLDGLPTFEDFAVTPLFDAESPMDSLTVAMRWRAKSLGVLRNAAEGP